MSTSNIGRVARDTLIAAAVAAVISLAISPADPTLAALPFHPAWIVALVLVARYGAGGLYAIPAVVVGLQCAVWIAGSSDVTVATRLSRPSELLVLLVIAVVAMIGALHQRRARTLEASLGEAEQRATLAEAAAENLCETALTLRERYDRTQTSYTFLADLTRRLDDPDPAGAGDAALALAMARTGARGGFVQLFDHGRLRTLCSRGLWSAERIDPPALFRDRVAHAAMERKRTVAAHEVTQASIDDSDLVAPLINTRGAIVGVLALRGIPTPALGAMAREDLAAVARWAGRVLEQPVPRTPAPSQSRGDVATAR